MKRFLKIGPALMLGLALLSSLTTAAIARTVISGQTTSTRWLK